MRRKKKTLLSLLTVTGYITFVLNSFFHITFAGERESVCMCVDSR